MDHLVPIATVTGVTATIKTDLLVTNLLPPDEDERHVRIVPLLPRGDDIGVFGPGTFPTRLRTLPGGHRDHGGLRHGTGTLTDCLWTASCAI